MSNYNRDVRFVQPIEGGRISIGYAETDRDVWIGSWKVDLVTHKLVTEAEFEAQCEIDRENHAKYKAVALRYGLMDFGPRPNAEQRVIAEAFYSKYPTVQDAIDDF